MEGYLQQLLGNLKTDIFGKSERIAEETPTGYRVYSKQIEPNILQRIADIITPEAQAEPTPSLPPGRSEFNPTTGLEGYISPQVPGLQPPSPMDLAPVSPDYTPHPSAMPYMDTIRSSAQEREIPEETLYRLLARESMQFNPDVISGVIDSPVGAEGIAQFMPDTAEWWQNSHGEFDPLVPEQAIPAAAHYLQYLYDQFGTWPETLAAYNWGEGNVRNQGIDVLPEETRLYIDAILGGGE